MLEVDIPGFGRVQLEHLVSDFTGTLSVDGRLCPGFREKLSEISKFLKIHILTADTFGRARAELEGIDCEVRILSGERHDKEKEKHIKELGPGKVMALGNGNNDRLMLKAAKIGIAVCLNEGCSVDALMSADILVNSPLDAFDLLINRKRLIASLRF